MRIQRELTSLGYKWNFADGDKPNQVIADKGDKYLYVTQQGYIFRAWYGTSVKGMPEYKLDDLGYITSASGAYTSPYIYDHTTETWTVQSKPEPNIKRPPLGLKPRALHDAARLKEILAAMTRYAEAGKEIPEKWLIELLTVNKGAQTPI